jgi:hypothetical protein
MNEERITESPSWNDPRGHMMKTPDDVAEMLRLKACGDGACSRRRNGRCPQSAVAYRLAAVCTRILPNELIQLLQQMIHHG